MKETLGVRDLGLSDSGTMSSVDIYNILYVWLLHCAAVPVSMLTCIGRCVCVSCGRLGYRHLQAW